MAKTNDRDRFFDGSLDASVPKQLLSEGTIARVINGRFIEGAITNGFGFDKLEVAYAQGEKARPSAQKNGFVSTSTFQNLLDFGDVQVTAPLSNLNGKFIVMVISGLMFQIDLDTCLATEITPRDSFLPGGSCVHPLSYLDNDGGTYGVGGYLVVFNYPNQNIFVTVDGARLARPVNPFWETPPARMGATAGSRAFVISGKNLMYASDPLGGANSLAPLTFQETLDPGDPTAVPPEPAGDFYQQVFNIGSALDVEEVTAICRLPRYFGASQEFLAQSLLVSTTRHKFTIAAGVPRSQWDSISSQFISFAGSSEGVAGPLACTNIGDLIVYISTGGRIKTLGQDTEINTGLTETFLDDPLGQYLCPCEANLYYRDWYETLDHSRSIIKFSGDRLYATVYPIDVPAINRFGDDVYSPSHRALAIGSLDSTTRLGPAATIAWEGFYDWLQPVGLVTIEDDLYVVSKNEFGHIEYYKQNLTKIDDHVTTVYTRGYFSSEPGSTQSMLELAVYFRRLAGPVNMKISYLINDEWVCAAECMVDEKLKRFSFRNGKCKSYAGSVPLKVDIDHKGCRFELAAVYVEGEYGRDFN